jgi:hypothetical protein
MLDRKLTAEIAHQLQSDILSYGWLLKISQEQMQGCTFEERTNAIVESLEALICEMQIVVGPASLKEGKVHIQNWGDTIDDTIREVRNFIDKHGFSASSVEADFGFWAGLPTTYPKRTKR